jgi:hypothetical protein
MNCTRKALEARYAELICLFPLCPWCPLWFKGFRLSSYLWFIARWNIEVTFEELRAQLGFETQREWSDKAIARTTPCLFGIFSLVVVMAKALHPVTLPIRQTSWYWKEEATFCDALAAVRSDLWRGTNYSASAQEADCILTGLWRKWMS